MINKHQDRIIAQMVEPILTFFFSCIAREKGIANRPEKV